MNNFDGVFYNSNDSLYAEDVIKTLIIEELSDQIELKSPIESNQIDHLQDISLPSPLTQSLLKNSKTYFFVHCKIHTQAQILDLWVSFTKGGLDQIYVDKLIFFYEIPTLAFPMSLAKQKQVIFDYPNKEIENTLNNKDLLTLLNSYFIKNSVISGYQLESIETLNSINFEDQTFLMISNLALQKDGIIRFHVIETINLINGIIEALP